MYDHSFYTFFHLMFLMYLGYLREILLSCLFLSINAKQLELTSFILTYLHEENNRISAVLIFYRIIILLRRLFPSVLKNDIFVRKSKIIMISSICS